MVEVTDLISSFGSWGTAHLLEDSRQRGLVPLEFLCLDESLQRTSLNYSSSRLGLYSADSDTTGFAGMSMDSVIQSRIAPCTPAQFDKFSLPERYKQPVKSKPTVEVRHFLVSIMMLKVVELSERSDKTYSKGV